MVLYFHSLVLGCFLRILRDQKKSFICLKNWMLPKKWQSYMVAKTWNFGWIIKDSLHRHFPSCIPTKFSPPPALILWVTGPKTQTWVELCNVSPNHSLFIVLLPKTILLTLYNIYTGTWWPGSNVIEVETKATRSKQCYHNTHRTTTYNKYKIWCVYI